MAGTTKLMTAGGGGVSLTPASSIASDVTVQVPSQNCTLGIAGPAFGATMSAHQTGVSASTYTKVQFNSEQFDTNNNYDPANYRFQPTVSGYYQLSASLDVGGSSLTGYFDFRKNGSTVVFRGNGSFGISQSEAYITGSGLTYMNGTTDYVEVYVYLAGTNLIVYSASNFSGFLARAA